MRARLSLLAAVLVTSSPAAAAAADRWVATTGDDAADGSEARPFATIARGVAALAAGDTLWVEPGTYAPTVGLSFSRKNGRADARYVVSGVPGKPRPVIDASKIASTAVGQQHGFAIYLSSFVSLRHLAITSSRESAVSIYGSSDVEVTDCELRRSQANGILAGKYEASSARHVFRFNWVHDNDLHNPGGANESGDWGQAIGLAGTDDAVVEGNLVEQNLGEGIDLYAGSSGSRMTANTVLDSYSVSLYLDHGVGDTIERNFVRTLDPAYYRSGRAAHGIAIADETGSGPVTTSNRDDVIRSNVVVGAAEGLYYGNYGWATGLRHATVIGNTFLRSGTSLAIFPPKADAGHEATVIAGNVFALPTGTQVYVPGGTAGLDVHGNAWFGNGAGIGGTGDVTTDPRLLDTDSGSPFDLVPAAGSPIVDVLASPLAPRDFLGAARPEGPAGDLGAFERPAAATTITVPLPAGVTDPSRVFTEWSWDDGAEGYVTVGVTTARVVTGRVTVTAVVHDPVAGSATTTVRTHGGEDAGARTASSPDDAGALEDGGSAASGDAPGDDGGCGCVVAGLARGDAALAGLAGGLVAAVTVLRRRRRA